MVQEREQQLLMSQNKAKLEQVQSRFPNDNLKLLEKEVNGSPMLLQIYLLIQNLLYICHFLYDSVEF